MTLTGYNQGMPWAEPEPPRDPMVQKGLDLLGAAMRRARRRHGWTQRELAARTGVHQSTISRFERGDRVGLRFKRFVLIVGVLGGLDFLPPELQREPTFTTRRQWLEWEAASNADWFRRHTLDDSELDEDELEDPEGDEAEGDRL